MSHGVDGVDQDFFYFLTVYFELVAESKQP